MFVSQATHFIATLRIARRASFHCFFRTAAFDMTMRMAVVTKRFSVISIRYRGSWSIIETVDWVEWSFVGVTVTFSRAKGILDLLCSFDDF